MITEKILELNQKQKNHPERFNKVLINNETAMTVVGSIDAGYIINACVIYEAGGKQIEWEVRNGKILKNPKNLLIYIKRWSKAWVMIGNEDEKEISFSYPSFGKDMSALIVGVVEIQDFVFAFSYDTLLQKYYYIEADKCDDEISDLFGLMITMRERRAEENGEGTRQNTPEPESIYPKKQGQGYERPW